MKRLLDAAFAAVWLAGVAYVAWSETRPDGYLVHVRGIREPQPYSVQRVVVLSALMAAHACGFWALARVWLRRSSMGGVLAAQALTLGVWVAALLLQGVMAMHAPPALAGYLLWLMSLGPVLLCLALAVLTGRGLTARRA